MSVTPADIRAAKAILAGEDETRISPRHLAASAKELKKPLSETLNFLARLLSGGQGQGPAPKTTKDVDILKPENAIAGDEQEFATEEGLPE